MASVKSFNELNCYIESRHLHKEAWLIINQECCKKSYRFNQQFISSIASVMNNIAEGFGRGGRKEFINFLVYACGSISEFESQLDQALDCNFIEDDQFQDLRNKSIKISIKLNNLISYLKKSELTGRTRT
jgi:four helix bundle protein